ncbi:MAG: hypothetical protein KatS3mg087_0309 [Patescibacteria group bacterium]|nr:MAG: hypothetical protein KatS3mg087_0309 [Patescibacteria group bacterium]
MRWNFLKRMIDFVGSLVALALFFPLLLVAGIALYIESGTPHFLYRPPRWERQDNFWAV